MENSDEYKDRIAFGTSKLSKNIFISIIVFGLLNVLSEFLKLNWLVVAFGILFVLAFFILWIAPGIFVIIGKAWLAYAWLRGLNPIWYPAKFWKQLSKGSKISIIVQSMIMTVSGSVVLIMILLKGSEL